MEQFKHVEVFIRESNSLITQTDVLGQTLKSFYENPSDESQESNGVFSMLESTMRADEVALKNKTVAYEQTKQ